MISIIVTRIINTQFVINKIKELRRGRITPVILKNNNIIHPSHIIDKYNKNLVLWYCRKYNRDSLASLIVLTISFNFSFGSSVSESLSKVEILLSNSISRQSANPLFSQFIL